MFRCLQTTKGMALLSAVTAVALYLIFWHGAHLAGVAPLLLLLAGPLLHVFGHRWHVGHRQNQRQTGRESPSPLNTLSGVQNVL